MRREKGKGKRRGEGARREKEKEKMGGMRRKIKLTEEFHVPSCGPGASRLESFFFL